MRDRKPDDRSTDALSKEQLESALTDVRAEAYLVEAERLRITRLVTSDDVETKPAEMKKLIQRQELIANRLEELDASTAGLRARIEQLCSAGTSPGDPADGNRRHSLTHPDGGG